MARKKPSIKRLKALCDAAISKWIRARSPICQICGKSKSEMAYHVISRRHLNTRWLIDNILASCGPCNLGENYHPAKYAAIFMNKFGADKYIWLEAQSRIVFQARRSDLEQILEKYK